MPPILSWTYVATLATPDLDVDVNDFLTSSACFNGALNPPNPGCP